MTKTKIAFRFLPAVLAVGGVGGAAGEEDPHLWLEDVTGEAALSWVKERSQNTVEAYAKDPFFTASRDRFKAILDSDERIPYVSRIGDAYYNFWRDAEHPRGLWRRTTMEQYRTESPEWETVLDVDALAEEEGENWVYQGSRCRETDYRRCLISLSRGGADANVVREFDMVDKEFVEEGFSLPEAKSVVAWADDDRLLVATDFGAGSLTESGYPRIIKEWQRGTPLADAEVVFEAGVEDVGVGVSVDLGNEYRHQVVTRATDFWNSDRFLRRDGQLIRIDAPSSANVALFRDRIYIRLTEDWSAGDASHPAGTLLTASLEGFLAGKREFETLFAPSPTTSLESFTLTRNHVVLNILDDVRNRIEVLTGAEDGWQREPMSGVGAFDSLGVGAVDRDQGDEFFLYVDGYLAPPSLAYGTIGSVPETLKAGPAFFDSAGLSVSQHFAESADGTRVPYFQVGRENDEPGPTLLYGYGGFEISMTPGYSPLSGTGWLERGGTFVVANIRGGGEYGPAWHRSALRENRPRAYEDFIAVAQDLIRRKVTTAAELGVMGGSNGGLLTGNMLTMRPDLFGAIVSQVPLLDMQRYHLLLAGASWMAEYGDPDVPEDWAFMQHFSPYHNVQEDADYPPVLMTTSTRDDRVHPGHARKMTAKMAALGHDVTYYENTEGGHAGAADNTQQAFMSALAYAFLWRHLGSEADLGDSEG